MALTETTLSTAKAAVDRKIVVASASGFAKGYRVRIDDEILLVDQSYDGSSTTIPVIPGQDGTAVEAHPVTAAVEVGAGTDSE